VRLSGTGRDTRRAPGVTPDVIPGVTPDVIPRDCDTTVSNQPAPRIEGEDVYRLLVESARDYAIFALDTAGRILTWNIGAERIKGYTRDEIVGQHFSVFYPPEDIAAGKPARELAEAIRDGRVEDEGWRLRKDGSAFWADVVITTLRDESGALVGFAKITRDLTDRRNAALALVRSEEQFRLLVQNVRDYAIFRLDADGRVASWNAGAEAIKGYRPGEIIGSHFSAFYTPEDVASGKPARALQIATQSGAYKEEGWRVRRDGTTFWASVVITPLRDVNGVVTGYAKITRDLTERRAAQQRALNDARRVGEAEAASRMKSEFLTVMSHELRTPINATIGYAQLIDAAIGGPVTEQQRDYVARICTSQQHLLRIINDLLDYGKISAKKVVLEFSPVAVQTIVDAVFPMIEPQAAVKGLELRRAQGPSDAVVRVDRIKAEQILLNLLSNAVKFTPAGGCISVTTAADGPWATVAVHDTGPGIPPDKSEAIFEPFVQLGRSLASGHQGTGLGLAISRDLAREMGGDIEVATTPGAGATFTVKLPRVERP
jgi:PAS domain S-box-containing protein